MSVNQRLALVGAFLCAVVLGMNASAAAAPAPSTPTLPAEYDPSPRYEAQSICSPTPKPGTRKLIALIKRTYGAQQSIGTTRSCVGGTSEHKDGRAIDWMAASSGGRDEVQAFVDWLVGPDTAGVPGGNATRLGVMYIGWKNHMWRAYGQGWTPLDGCPAGDATSCHRNHVHISLTWDGASGRTSFWDGTVLTGYCSSASTSATIVDLSRAADAIPVAPFAALDTRAGTGLVNGGFFFGGGWSGDGDWGGSDGWSRPGGWGFRADPTPTPTVTAIPVPTMPTPCRVHAGGRRDGSGVLTKVTGQGGVPDLGVAAVAVRIRALQSTAPATVSVWGPGEIEPTKAAKIGLNQSAVAQVIVPVASDGTIALSTSMGAVDLLVEVTGYFTTGDQPNRTVVYG
ncbi:MAG: hypothetical protein Q7K25_02410 [Actinomycetota bacterium]|nr:hypothetical protein [Actinomycetota bacterium]